MDDRPWEHEQGFIERCAELLGGLIILSFFAPFIAGHMIVSTFLNIAFDTNRQDRMNVVEYSRWVGNPSRNIDN